MQKRQAELSFRDSSDSQEFNPNFFISKPRKVWGRQIRVQCLECSTKFRTSSHFPECPGCGGGDVELA